MFRGPTSSAIANKSRFSGTRAGVKESISLVKTIAKQHQAGNFEFATSPEDQLTLWSARKEALWSMLALRKEGEDVWSTDVAVPLSRLPDIIGAFVHFCAI
jgi:D-lactate dehydrogenase (cytochrome)